MFTVSRSRHNPILSPVPEHPWEAFATFNASPIVQGKKTHLIYRAGAKPDSLKGGHFSMSVIGKATSSDGRFFTERQVLVSPTEEYDRFGCEDPRVTKFENKYYIFYTALGSYPFNAQNIKVAVAISKDLKTVQKKHLVTPFNAKAMTLFPERINGKMAALLTFHTDQPPSDICYAEFNAEEDLWSPDYWNNWSQNIPSHALEVRRVSGDHVEIGSAPLKTDKGWLVAYSHIQRYNQGSPVFGIEFLLLDLTNPRKIIGRTKGPFMVPEAYYEHVGQVPNIIFPSGLVLRGDTLEVHYGAADTHCALATIPLSNLLESLLTSGKSPIERFSGNPIITPRPGVAWEEKGTFNAAAVEVGNSIHILYRAFSHDNVSTIGYARTKDGLNIDERSDTPIYLPRTDFEKNHGEIKNCGCEDPRVMKIGKRLYMLYTAYDGSVPRVAITSILLSDFLKKRWDMWAEPHVITPSGIDDKDAVLLNQQIKKKYMILHRIGGAVCADYVSSLDFTTERIKECIEMLGPRPGMWDGAKVGVAAPPIRTSKGWLLFYHGVSWSTTYRVGAVLLDLKDPTIIRARTAIPLFSPHEEYEKKGAVPNVVFPCGIVERKGMLYMYYGGADSVLAVATVKLATVLNMLKV